MQIFTIAHAYRVRYKYIKVSSFFMLEDDLPDSISWLSPLLIN